MAAWASIIKKVSDKVSLGIVAANNHYAGFGAATANEFRKMLGMKEAIWDELKQQKL